MAKTSKEKQRKDNMSSSSSVTSVEDQPIKKTKRTRKCVPRDSPQKRSSIYRGVTRHRWTGRYEAHLWDKTCWNESQKKKGRQVYLGAYDDELAAAHAYDLAALKYWGQDTIINFPLSTYQKELEEMELLTKEEYIGSLRRKSSGFSRGVSKYRGVARHHHNGRWEARIGRVFGNKYLYLGTYATQEAAATAYDIAAIEYRGINAVTNFEISRYIKWLKPNQGKGILDINININPQQTNSSNLVEMDFTPNPTEEFESVFRHHHHQQHLHQSSSAMESTAAPPPPTLCGGGGGGGGGNASTALGLLLQSTKFKEMLELTSVGVECPSAIPEPIVQPRRSFPDDIQTYFDCNHSANFTDDHEGIFGDFASVMFPNELDT